MMNLLKRLSNADLESLIGTDVLRIFKHLSSVAKKNDLAAAILARFGDEVLNEKRLREYIIDTLSVLEVESLSKKCGIEGQDDYDSRSKLIAYFTNNYTVLKSEILVTFFQLDEAYTKKIVKDERSSKEFLANKFNEPFKLKPYLHYYQKDIKDLALEYLEQDKKYFMIQMPTGAGKTYTALEILVDSIRLPKKLRKKYLVWIVDNNQLSEQALESFVHLWKSKGDHPIHVYRFFKDFADYYENLPGGVVFTSFDKLNAALKNSTHEYHQSAWSLIDNTEMLIVDEAHTSVAETYLSCLGKFKNSGAKIIGLSATPGRNDSSEAVELSNFYQAEIIPKRDPTVDPVKRLQDEGYLAKLEFKLLETGFSTNVDEALINEVAAEDKSRNEMILSQMRQAHNNEESTLCFTCNVSHMLALFLLLKNEGIPAEVIYMNTPQSVRLDIIDRFKRKQFYLLLNVDLLSTGLDVPKLDKVILTRPVNSSILVSQIFGRVLRGTNNGGNASNTVICLKDNLLNFPDINLLYNGFTHYWRT